MNPCISCKRNDYSHVRSILDGNTVVSEFKCPCGSSVELTRIYKGEKEAEVGLKAILRDAMAM